MTTRIPLPMAAPPAHKACTECGQCCTYVSVGINPPRTLRFASDVLWFLYHDGVSVHRDGDGDWSVVFETRCRHLRGDLRCGVYAHRPQICRAFDDTTCEVNSPEGGLSFADPARFLDWLRVTQPGLFRRLAARFVPPAPAPAPTMAAGAREERAAPAAP